jgi:hypothetical protein
LRLQRMLGRRHYARQQPPALYNASDHLARNKVTAVPIDAQLVCQLFIVQCVVRAPCNPIQGLRSST